MASRQGAADDADPVVAAARLFSRLLLREIDAGVIRRLGALGVADWFTERGMELPEESDAVAIENLAAEYFSHVVQPERWPPLVQSLHEQGVFEGEAAAGVRSFAGAAGVAFERSAARGASVDHLGAEFALWASLREAGAHDVARSFAERHLAWARRPLRNASGASFYERLLGEAAEFLETIVEADGGSRGDD